MALFIKFNGGNFVTEGNVNAFFTISWRGCCQNRHAEPPSIIQPGVCFFQNRNYNNTILQKIAHPAFISKLAPPKHSQSPVSSKWSIQRQNFPDHKRGNYFFQLPWSLFRCFLNRQKLPTQKVPRQ